MMRAIGVKFVDIPELSKLENLLRRSNEVHHDRQIRVKLEAYESRMPVKPNLKPIITSFPDHMPSSLESDKLGHWPESAKSNGSGSKRTFSETDCSVMEVNSSTEPDFTSNEKEKRLRLVENDDKVDVPDVGVVVYPLSSGSLYKGNHPKKNLFKNLQLVLNLAFSDYVFDSVKISQFKRYSLADALSTFLNQFREHSSDSTIKIMEKEFVQSIRNIVGTKLELDFNVGLEPDKLKLLDDVQVYSYIPEPEADMDEDPLSTVGNLWALNFFFCNPVTGKVVLLAASCRQRKFSQNGAGLSLSHSIPENDIENSYSYVWEDNDEVLEDTDDEDDGKQIEPDSGSHVGMAY